MKTHKILSVILASLFVIGMLPGNIYSDELSSHPSSPLPPSTPPPSPERLPPGTPPPPYHP